MKKLIFTATAIGVACSVAPNSYAQTADAEASRGGGPIDEIIVTARRREESVQSVPVSITALNADALEQHGIEQLQDLTFISPGLRFGNEGGRTTMSVSLRGLSQLTVGEGVPAVVTYFADVPLIGDGVNIPTYDLDSVQVLKGPQGTLFGRNTIGGAVLVNPKKPTYDWEGYAQVNVGNYDAREGEGALNIPIRDGIAALRIAGQYRKRDGRTKNLSGGKAFDDVDQQSARVSLLLEPTENLSNTLMFDYFNAEEQPGGLVYINYNPGVFAGILGGGLAAQGMSPDQISAITGAYEASLLSQFQQQQAAGPFAVLSDLDHDLTGVTPGMDRKLRGLTNTTRLELGGVTLRNILGYRKHSVNEKINTGGVDAMQGPLGPITLFHATNRYQKEFLSDEFQVLGETDRLNWIVGAFYSHDQSTGPMGKLFQAFDANADGPTLNYSTSHLENTGYALFGQVGYKLTDALTLNVGVRYSHDKIKACGAPGPQFFSSGECEQLAALDLPDGAGIVKNSGSAPTWTLGLDYNITDQVFAYFTTRRGYRSANVNTPAFETPFTTGGVAPELCLLPGGACPDFRPFQKTDKEEVTDYELGLKSEWGTTIRGRTNLALFHTQYKNALQFFNVLGTGVFFLAPDLPSAQSLAVNAADLSMTGLDFEVAVSPIQSLTLSLNGTYIDQKVDKLVVPPIGGLTLNKDQVQLPTPKFSGTAGARYVFPTPAQWGELAINADYFHTSKWKAQIGQSFPSYELLNARLEWNQIAGSGVDAALWVRNALDKEYMTAPSNLLPSFPTNTAYYGDPRMYGLQLSYRFGK